MQEDGASGDTGSGARQEVADDEVKSYGYVAPTSCACRAPLLSSASPQFLSLDDLPDSRSNVNLRTDHTPSVSAPPLWVGWV